MTDFSVGQVMDQCWPPYPIISLILMSGGWVSQQSFSNVNVIDDSLNVSTLFRFDPRGDASSGIFTAVGIHTEAVT